MSYNKIRHITYLFCFNIVNVTSRYKVSIPIGATSVKNRQDILTFCTIARALKKGDAVMGAVVRNERDVARLKVDRGTDDDSVPIDHLLHSSRL